MADQRYRAQSVVLRTPPPAAEAEVERFAEALGWPVRGEIPADPEHGVPFEVQWAAGPALTLHYVVDDLSGTAHVTVSGIDQPAVDGARALAERHLDMLSFAELIRAAGDRKAARERGRALIRAGVGAPPEFDERLAKLVREFLAGADPVLREAALWTMSYVPAAEYRDLLGRAAEHDPDPRLRQTAAGILAAYDQGGVPR